MTTPTTAIDAETMAKAKFCVIGILCDLAKAEVEGRPLLDDGSADRFGQVIARAIQAAKDEGDHFKAHFTKLARVNAEANAALDTARREWAKKGTI